MAKKNAVYTYNPTTTAKNRSHERPLPKPRSIWSDLPNNTVHKSLLHFRNLPLERINLLPAIQRPTIIQPQTPNNISLGPRNVLIQLSQLSPPIQPAAQLVDLAHDRIPRDIPVHDGLLRRRFLGRSEEGRGLVFPAREGDPRGVEVQRAGWVGGACWGGACGGLRGEGAGVFRFCEFLLDLGEGLLFAFAEAFEFLGHAVLDLEFEGLGAGGVRLFGGLG